MVGHRNKEHGFRPVIEDSIKLTGAVKIAPILAINIMDGDDLSGQNAMGRDIAMVFTAVLQIETDKRPRPLLPVHLQGGIQLLVLDHRKFQNIPSLIAEIDRTPLGW